MNTLSKSEIVSTWMRRALEMFYLGFVTERPTNFASFAYAMGAELCLKALILAERYHEYGDNESAAVLHKIDKIALNLGHKFYPLIKSAAAYDDDFRRDILTTLSRKVSGRRAGRSLIPVLNRANIECRYPVPTPIHLRFPISKTRPGGYQDYLGSSDLHGLSQGIYHAVSRSLIKRHGFEMKPELAGNLIHGEQGRRWCRVFFATESPCTGPEDCDGICS